MNDKLLKHAHGHPETRHVEKRHLAWTTRDCQRFHCRQSNMVSVRGRVTVQLGKCVRDAESVRVRKRVNDWFKCFCHGKETTEDKPGSGQPSTSRTPDMIERVWKCWHKIRLYDSWRRYLAWTRRWCAPLSVMIWVDFVPGLCRIRLTDEQKGKWMETSGDSLLSVTRILPSFLRTIVGATSWIRNPNSNRWNGGHRLARDPKRVACESPRSRHCWSPSSATMASSVRNSFLCVKPLWNGCCCLARVA